MWHGKLKKGFEFFFGKFWTQIVAQLKKEREGPKTEIKSSVLIDRIPIHNCTLWIFLGYGEVRTLKKLDLHQGTNY